MSIITGVKFVSRYRWVILAVSVMCQVGASLGDRILAPLAPPFQLSCCALGRLYQMPSISFASSVAIL